MQPFQLEQLKKSIMESSVLNSSEREEWLGLLEFMNDKQLSDLQQIISQRHVDPVVTPTPPKPQPAKVSPVIPPTAPQSAPSAVLTQGTPLAAFLEQVQHTPPPTSPPQPKKAPQKSSVSKKSPFKRRLEVMLDEKELPPGSKIASISDHASPAKPIQSSPVPPPVREKQLPKREVPPVVSPTTPVSKAEPHPPPAPAPAATVVPHALLDLPFAAAYAPELNGPGDLPKITVRTLRDLGVEELKKRIQNFIQRTDYFEAIFLLEKSPLYRMYVSIGKIMLESRMSFEAIAAACQERNLEYLTKEEFESFTDLLRSVRTV